MRVGESNPNYNSGGNGFISSLDVPKTVGSLTGTRPPRPCGDQWEGGNDFYDMRIDIRSTSVKTQRF